MPAFDYPWVWLLAPLALVPLVRPAGDPLGYSSLAAVPADTLSSLLAWGLKIAGAGATLAAVAGIAGPHVRGEPIERIGRGAEIVLLLDRSRSMDQPFHVRGDNVSAVARLGSESKGTVARRLLSRFAAGRSQDRFAMVVFSAFPMRVLDFTDKPAIVEAAIGAGQIGRGLGDTNIGSSLLAALSYFEGRTYTGSRVILLVSDGGAHIDEDVQREIVSAFKRYRASLRWIYLRSYNSPGLLPGEEISGDASLAVPEHFLHEFFGRLGSPYRAYEAEDPQSMEQAIADVGRLENFPIHYQETRPRRDLAPACYAVALAMTLLIAAAAWLEVRRWT